MAAKVLVAYGTKYGATGEIADKIGQTLRDHGLAVDVALAGKAGSPADYAAGVGFLQRSDRRRRCRGADERLDRTEGPETRYRSHQTA